MSSSLCLGADHHNSLANERSIKACNRRLHHFVVELIDFRRFEIIILRRFGSFNFPFCFVIFGRSFFGFFSLRVFCTKCVRNEERMMGTPFFTVCYLTISRSIPTSSFVVCRSTRQTPPKNWNNKFSSKSCCRTDQNDFRLLQRKSSQATRSLKGGTQRKKNVKQNVCRM